MTQVEAFSRQIQASDPAGSVWLSANAGSGKTRVLTDRVARLLLRGVDPQRILCLTFTKAAASEMQNRLFRRLGGWTMLPDATLHHRLMELGDDSRSDPDALAKARRLFARAIETPGGLRIQTIHSFCAGLLRRFPLEAGVSPQFAELDDRAAKLLREAIIEELADFRAPQAVADLARAYSGEDFSALMEQVAGNRSGFSSSLSLSDALGRFGSAPNDSIERLFADVFLGGEIALFRKIRPSLLAGGTTDVRLAERLDKLDEPASLAGLALLEDAFLFGAKTKTPFGAKIGTTPTKDVRAALGPMLPELEALMLRTEAARPRRLALEAAENTVALHRFAAAFLPLYEATKASRGLLDFDDLITRTKRLLTDPRVAAWVLFRLDGGIDHILVDEAQDTSPDQWRIIELLAAEFTTGAGARPEGRTLFVVGDKKQSIYSFQGADVAAFDQKHDQFRNSFRSAGQQFSSLDLEHSFRSSPAILTIVDQSLGGHFPKALGDKVVHRAFKDTMPGRVDLWPLIEKSATPTDENWEDPVDLVSDDHQFTRLAERIAQTIKSMIDGGHRIPVDADESPVLCRQVHAGDFLVLVQRRSTLFAEIIRACKAAGLPIAGADRLKLAAELAVKDLTALVSFLATPEDDLSLAALLRSPLCGWSEEELFALAHDRKGFLWENLRNSPVRPDTQAMFDDLRRQADFLRPYDLIERVLTRHDGRRRFLARLGPEAEDGIDEFLNQALAFERHGIPSLTGFLVWLESDDIEIKRQMDSAGHRIRVMTVHGAKGLEAPIVVLPDTADRTPPDRDHIYQLPDGVPVWKTAKAESPPVIAAVAQARQEEAEEESLRLLYVALTRARCQLIICGAGEAKKPSAWYRIVEAGLKAAGAETRDDGSLRYSYGEWPATLRPPTSEQELPMALPDWATAAAISPPRPGSPLSPSDLGGEKATTADEGGLGQEAAMLRGTAIHRLLEFLPSVARSDWLLVAKRLVPDQELLSSVYEEAEQVLASPELATVFADDALVEVAFAADLLGETAVGAIDRLLVRDDHVLAVDFKSNSHPPKLPKDTPEGILRQLGAYAEALRHLYPAKRVEMAVVWTRTAQLMRFDLEMLRASLARTAIP